MEVDGDGGCQSAKRAVRGNLVGLEVRLCLNDLFLADDGTTGSTGRVSTKFVLRQTAAYLGAVTLRRGVASTEDALRAAKTKDNNILECKDRYKQLLRT